jgi:superfamily I DNA and/or RNA helicase
LVNHIPINIALESRYLRQRIAKLLEKEKKYRVYSGTILRIMRRRNQYYIQIGLGKEIREFNIKMRDNIEIENHLFGKVYKIGENSIYVNLDDLGHISKGQIVDFKKTSEVTIIQSQREALAYFSENENVNFRLFKECLFRNNDIPNNKNSSLNFENQSLNPAQKEAVERALCLNINDPFTLIQGPPGTGKTTLIAEIVYQILKRNQKALISSHTNIAIDNALEKILEQNSKLANNICKVGDPVSTLPQIHGILVDTFPLAAEKNIVGATLTKLTVGAKFNKVDWTNPQYDYVIIDECSMATLSQAICAIMLGYRIILIGDQKQLPPILPECRTKELQTSLFEKLIETYPRKSTMLDVQYRSNEKIMGWSCDHIYNGLLKTHSTNQNIQLKTNIRRSNKHQSIVNGINPIVWIDLQGSRRLWRKYGSGDTCYNPGEAALTIEIIQSLLACVLPIEGLPKKISTISPYRLHADVVGIGCDKKFSSKVDLTEIGEYLSSSTVDSFQGREKETIIYNLVQTDDHISIKDEKRLNVAVTRGKRKVIIISSFNNFNYSLRHLRSLKAYVQKHGFYQKCRYRDLDTSSIAKVNDIANNLIYINSPKAELRRTNLSPEDRKLLGELKRTQNRQRKWR